MADVTFIHSSDFQLGMNRWFLGQEHPVFDAARLEAVQALGTLAQERNAAFIVVAGDVFDANSLSESVIGRSLEVLSSLPVPVYLLPGNHDPLVADSVFARTADISNVTVVSSTEPIDVAPGVELIGAPWFSKHPSGDVLAPALRDLAPSNTIRVALGHGQVETRFNGTAPGYIDLEEIEQSVDNGSVDYVALGDTHSTMSLGRTGKIWYSGSPETTDFAEDGGGGESNSGNALVVSISKDGAVSDVDVEAVQVGRWTFDALKAHLTSAEDVDSFLQRLDAYPAKSTTVIKYGFTGILGLEAYDRLHKELDRYKAVFANVYQRRSAADLPIEPTQEELEKLELGGVARAALDELASRRDDANARDAVYLLYRLARKA